MDGSVLLELTRAVATVTNGAVNIPHAISVVDHPGDGLPCPRRGTLHTNHITELTPFDADDPVMCCTSCIAMHARSLMASQNVVSFPTPIETTLVTPAKEFRAGILRGSRAFYMGSITTNYRKLTAMSKVEVSAFIDKTRNHLLGKKRALRPTEKYALSLLSMVFVTKQKPVVL
jgi:hypothetical protein